MIEAMSTRPARLLGTSTPERLAPGASRRLMSVDLRRMPWIVRERKLKSRSRNTAFEGARMSGKVLRTMVGGQTGLSIRSVTPIPACRHCRA